jgi:hypothetical protein
MKPGSSSDPELDPATRVWMKPLRSLWWLWLVILLAVVPALTAVTAYIIQTRSARIAEDTRI